MVRSRAWKWATGLAVTGILAVLSVASLAGNRAALAERETAERNAATYRAWTGRADGVVVETRYRSVTAETYRMRLAVSYRPSGGERLVNWITVPVRLGPFHVGDPFEVAYDPAHPERAASAAEAGVLARDPRGLERLVGEGGVRDRSPSFRPALVTGVLAAAVLAGTVFWATSSRVTARRAIAPAAR